MSLYDKKFERAIKLIFFLGIIVSCNDTVHLYESSGFNRKLFSVWIIGDITLAWFATAMAEMAFTVGFWGISDIFLKTGRVPGIKDFPIWMVFGGGLFMVGWSNISTALGINYLFTNPHKGLLLGLSIPYFILGSVLVSLRLYTKSIQANEGHTKEENNEQAYNEHILNIGQNVYVEQDHTKNIEQETEQANIEKIYIEQKSEQTEQNSEYEQTKSEQSVQLNDEQMKAEQKEHTCTEQVNEQPKLYVVNNERTKRKGTKKDYAKEVAEQMKAEQPNEKITVRKLAERADCSLAIASSALRELNEQIS